MSKKTKKSKKTKRRARPAPAQVKLAKIKPRAPRPSPSWKSFTYLYPVLSAASVDGDTVKVNLDLGFLVTATYKCRLYGVDTPEKNTLAGKLVTQVTSAWLDENENLLVCKSIDKGKYAGRFIGIIGKRDEADVGYEIQDDLSTFLLSHKFGVPYNGGRRGVWTPEKLREVEEIATKFLLRSGRI
jgi:hypothetical protein